VHNRTCAAANAKADFLAGVWRQNVRWQLAENGARQTTLLVARLVN
jgi:hypothetical protein